ncbi:Fas-binding factor-like protein [Citrus sinensis]|uniref:Fas-binding factor-like protein n=1 Tax=Citrus sinensis TaxID=2711 RepID=A0ACB8KJK9_CITSI|nr:Fas-binding factor-like protein [Citrus sinensis]
MDNNRMYIRQKTSVYPTDQSSSPSHRHTRSGSVSNVRKAQTKAAAQRLAAVMAHKPSDETDDDDDDDDDHSRDYRAPGGPGVIGLSGTGGRTMRSRSPSRKPMAQRRTQMMPDELADEDNDDDDDDDDDYGLVSGKASIGLVSCIALCCEIEAKTVRRKTVNQQADADNFESYDYSKASITGSIGYAGGRSVRSPSPAAKSTPPQKLKQETVNRPASEDNDEDCDYGSVTGRASIGLAGGRSVRTPSPLNNVTPQKYKQETGNQPANENKDENNEYSKDSGTGSIGFNSGKSRKTRTPMYACLKYHIHVHFYTGLHNEAQTISTPQRSMDEENGENYDYSLVSGKASIGLAGGRGIRSPTPNIRATAQKQIKVTANQPTEEENDVDNLSYGSRYASRKTSIGHAGRRAMRSPSPMSVRTNPEELPSVHSTSGARSSLSVNSMDQQSSAPLNLVERPSYSTVAGRPSQSTDCMEQPSSARSTSSVNSNSRVKTVAMLPSAVPISLRPSSATPSEVSVENLRERRSSVDFGNANFREADNQRSASALQDELDMLQEENEILHEKLQLVEERCEEAEARSRQLEKQAALKVAARSHGSNIEEIAALQTEAETARDEATIALETLQHSEDEIRSLRNRTQRMILTQEEMEEVVLKRCWLARYWNFCVQYAIHAEIAKAKHDYWSSFAPLPLEMVLGAGQRAKEENLSESTAAEEREKVLKDLKELSGDGNIESMLLVEKGLRELAYLKVCVVEDAIALSMAQQRRLNQLKSELSPEESEDTRFKQAWLTYFWRRAKDHGVESDIADDRFEFWVVHSGQSSSSQDAVDVERGLAELRKLGLESQLWQRSRKGLEEDFKSQLEYDF